MFLKYYQLDTRRDPHYALGLALKMRWGCGRVLLRFLWKCTRVKSFHIPINERVSAPTSASDSASWTQYTGYTGYSWSTSVCAIHCHFGRIVKNKHFQRNGTPTMEMWPLPSSALLGVQILRRMACLTYSQEVVVPVNLSAVPPSTLHTMVSQWLIRCKSVPIPQPIAPTHTLWPLMRYSLMTYRKSGPLSSCASRGSQ